jgi:plasmid stability protein
MKNVTIVLDDDIHRKARVYAAERGTSLSALVKIYLTNLVDGDIQYVQPQPTHNQGVREMQSSFEAMPVEFLPAPLHPSNASPHDVGGKSVWTKDGKPRKPGAMRILIQGAPSDDDSWPDGFLDAMLGDDTDAAKTWWK